MTLRLVPGPRAHPLQLPSPRTLGRRSCGMMRADDTQMKPFGAFLAAWILLVPPVGSPQGKSEATSHDWPVYAGNAENTQHSALAEINRDNVKQLRVAWTIDTGDPWV